MGEVSWSVVLFEEGQKKTALNNDDRRTHKLSHGFLAVGSDSFKKIQRVVRVPVNDVNSNRGVHVMLKDKGT